MLSLTRSSTRSSTLLSLLSLSRRSLIRSSLPNFEPQNKLLPELLLPCFEKHAGTTAFVDHVKDISIAHSDCGDIIAQLANQLLSYGVKPGDHVAVCSPNHLYYINLMLAIISTGATSVMCNPGYTGRELEHLFLSAAVTHVIGHSNNSEHVMSVAARMGVSYIGEISTLSEQYSQYSNTPPKVEMGIHDTCCMFFSSGTTGPPKAVEVTHDNFVSQLMLLSIHDPDYKAGSVGSGVLPFFHCMGCVAAMNSLHNGAKHVILEQFEPKSFLEAHQNHKIGHSITVPPIMVFLSKHPLVSQYDLSSLAHLFCGAAPLSRSLEEDVQKRLGNPNLQIRQGYGLTETIGQTHAVMSGTKSPGSIGVLGSNMEAKIVDVEGIEVAQGCSGEILLRGPVIMKGYYNNKDATKEAFTEDGFLRTGDIGYIDEEENFYIVDRLKEFIKVKGFQVSPSELEALLLEHDDIIDSAVVGIPDEKWGERPKAFVVKRPNCGLTEEQVIEFVTRNTIDFKIPAEVVFIKMVPRLPSGKIQKQVLLTE